MTNAETIAREVIANLERVPRNDVTTLRSWTAITEALAKYFQYWEKVDSAPTAGLARDPFTIVWQATADLPVAIWIKTGVADIAWTRLWPAADGEYTTAYAIDFSTLDSVGLGVGNNTIDGVRWTISQGGGPSPPSLADILNGTGLRLSSPVSGSSGWSQSVRTAMRVFTVLDADQASYLGAVYNLADPNFITNRDFLIYAQLTFGTWPTVASDQQCIGACFSDNIANDIGNLTSSIVTVNWLCGANQGRSAIVSGEGSFFTANTEWVLTKAGLGAGVHDVVCFRVRSSHIEMFSGVYAGGWPAISSMRKLGRVVRSIGTQQVRPVVGFIAHDLNGVASLVLQKFAVLVRQ